MKKILSTILVIFMIATITPFAYANDYTDIEPLKPVTVTASTEENPTFRFVAEETKSYKVTSYAPEEIDPYCIIESDNGDETLQIDDTNGSWNFAERFEFEAGNVYYLTIYTNNEEEATFEFVLECAHEWVEDVCVDCEKVCDHNTENSAIMTCECGKVSNAPVITLGETKVITEMVDYAVYKFVPQEDVTAIFSSNVYSEEFEYDVSASIYDEYGNVIENNDDFGGTLDFLILYEFTAGETYFLRVDTFYEGIDVEFSLVPAIHTTADGEEHPLVYVEETFGTCVEVGYSEAIYCEECEEYIVGHEEGEYGFCEDSDWDDICDYCGEEIDYSSDDDTDIDTENGFLDKILNLIKTFVNLILNLLTTFM